MNLKYTSKKTFTKFYLGYFCLYLAVFLVEPPISQATNFPLVASGTYTSSGPGAPSSRQIPVGFVPDVVILQRTDAVAPYAIIRTSAMPDDNSKPMAGGYAMFTGRIRSFYSDGGGGGGFTVGSTAETNSSTTADVPYTWVAFKAATGKLSVGTYSGTYNSGNGTGAPQQITGLGFSPEYVMVFTTSTFSGVHKSSTMSGSTSYFFDSDSGNTNRITALGADGFSVGTSGTTNTLGTAYYYVAWDQSAGMNNSTYTGNGADNRSITGVGFQPAYVIVASENSASLEDMHRMGPVVGDPTFGFGGGYLSDHIQAIESDGFQVGTHNRVNQSTRTYHWIAFAENLAPAYTQSAYRFFSNANGLDVGAALAAQDTAATLTSTGEEFRMRMLLHVDNDQLYQSGENFKLQFVDKNGGTCASPGGAGTPASYTDVTTSTLISYKDNATPSDGTALTTNASDPSHNGHTIISQTYEETNNFTNSVAAIPSGQDGKWDFSLYDNGAVASTTYCFRVVESDGTELTYSVYPEITTFSGDTTSPTVMNVTSSTGDGSYNAGDVISIQVEFDEAVVVTGTPQLTLETGGTDAVVNYSGGSGSTTLTFDYTIASGENSADLDYFGVNALAGTIKDSANNNADLTLATPGQPNSLGANKAIVVDTVIPVISSVTPVSSTSINNVTTSSGVSYSLSENTDNGTITITQTGGTADVNSPHTCTLAGAALTSGTHTIDFSDTVNGCNPTVTLVDGAVYTFEFDVRDEAGNTAITITSTDVTYDATSPTVTNVTSSSADGTYGEGETISVEVEFTETVTVTGTPQLTLETEGTDAVVDYSSGSGSTTLIFDYTVASGENSTDLEYVDTNSLSLNGGTITDAAENNADLTLATPGQPNSLGANKQIIVDTTSSIITGVTSSTSDGSYNEGDIISIEVEFDEVVIVTGIPQLTLETGGTDAVVDYSSGSGSTTLIFDYTVGSGENSTDLDYANTNSLSLNGGTITDEAENNADLTLSTPGQPNSLGANNAIIVDTTAPVISDVIPVSSSSINNVTTLSDVEYTLNEDVDSGTITITQTGGTADPDSPHTCTLAGTALTSGVHTIDFSDTTNGCNPVVTIVDGAMYTFEFDVRDEAGNTATTITSTNVAYDATSPIVTNVTSSTVDGTYGEGETISIEVEFDEVVTVSGTPQLTLETGNTDAVADYTSGSGSTTLTFDYTIGSGENSVDLDYEDTNSLSLNGGTIIDEAENAATLTLPIPGQPNSLGANKAIVVDTPATPPPTPPSPTPSPSSNTGHAGGGGGGGGLGFATLRPPSSTPSPTPEPPVSNSNNEENTETCENKNTQVPFIDISNHWAQNLIEEYYNECAFDGKETEQPVTEFNPDSGISRAELSSIIVKRYNLNNDTYKNLFSDVMEHDWFAKDVISIALAGIIRDYEIKPPQDLFFNPDKLLTRAEVLGILTHYKGIYSEGLKTSFADVSLKEWFYNSVAYAQMKGLVKGYEVKSGNKSVYYFKPYQQITKAEALQMVESFEELKGI